MTVVRIAHAQRLSQNKILDLGNIGEGTTSRLYLINTIPDSLVLFDSPSE